jgi:predicted hydrocarbon binding protein
MTRELIIGGIVSVAFTRRTTGIIYNSIYNILGKNGANALLYNTGRNVGRAFVEKEKEITKSENMELLNKCIQIDIEAGFGEFEYNVDFNAFEGEVRLYDSFLAEAWIEATGKKQEYPVCALLSGYIAGIIEATFGEKVVVEEKACIALGNEHCLFKVRKDILGD